MEEAVYNCTWIANAQNFTVWVLDKPILKVVGKDQDSALQNLQDLIEEKDNCISPILEFSPPLLRSSKDASYSQPELVLVCAEGSFEVEGPKSVPFESAEERELRQQHRDSYFTALSCRVCCTASGARSDRPLTLTYLDPKIDGAFGSLGDMAGTRCELLSDAFVNLLSDAERNALELRPVKLKGRRKFYELIGPSGPSLVAVADLPVSGWFCPSCHFRSFGYWLLGMEIHDFVSSEALPSRSTSVFTVGQQPYVHLCMTAQRWSQLIGKPGTRGFISRPLGVIRPEKCLVNPDLPIKQEEWWRAR